MLTVNGVTEVPLTAEPDAAERGAEAVLSEKKPKHKERKSGGYYHQLSDHIKEARKMEVRVTTRWIAWCEQELIQLPDVVAISKMGASATTKSERALGRLIALENGLYERMDVVDRVGESLEHRWQSCMAEVSMRLQALSAMEPRDSDVSSALDA